MRRQLQLLREQHKVDDLLTYDDLLARNKELLARLSASIVGEQRPDQP